MKSIFLSAVIVMSLSCQRYHTRTQTLNNNSSDTLVFLNTGNGETEIIYPGNNYQMAFQEKLGKEPDGISCNEINPNFEISTYSGKSVSKSLFDDSHWTTSVTEDKDTEQACVFTVNDEDIID